VRDWDWEQRASLIARVTLLRMRLAAMTASGALRIVETRPHTKEAEKKGSNMQVDTT